MKTLISLTALLATTVGTGYLAYRAAPESFDNWPVVAACPRLEARCKDVGSTDIQLGLFCFMTAPRVMEARLERPEGPGRLCAAFLDVISDADSHGWDAALARVHADHPAEDAQAPEAAPAPKPAKHKHRR